MGRTREPRLVRVATTPVDVAKDVRTLVPHESAVGGRRTTSGPGYSYQPVTSTVTWVLAPLPVQINRTRRRESSGQVVDDVDR